MSRDFAPLLNTRDHWWQDCGEIARLIRWLGEGIELKDAIAIVEKPWNWDAEYQEMCDEQKDAGVARENEKLAKSEEGT